ncbi:hypothetical protein U1Q18_019769 [Sarracenia purpurea var. burkii]
MVGIAEEGREDNGEDGFGGFNNVGEGNDDFGEGNAGGNVADCVEESGFEEGDDEGFGDFRTWLELERPEEEHPDGADEELERKTENQGGLKGFARFRNLEISIFVFRD